jgi:hypothetical protein
MRMGEWVCSICSVSIISSNPCKCTFVVYERVIYFVKLCVSLGGIRVSSIILQNVVDQQARHLPAESLACSAI